MWLRTALQLISLGIDLHLPISNLLLYQKGTYYSGIKVFNSLPSQIKDLSHNRIQFKCALKNFLYFHFFFMLWMNILAVIGFKILTIVQLFFCVLEFCRDDCWLINWFWIVAYCSWNVCWIWRVLVSLLTTTDSTVVALYFLLDCLYVL